MSADPERPARRSRRTPRRPRNRVRRRRRRGRGARRRRCRSAPTGKNRADGAQRELRPRADGAAHARRRRRLHAEGRHEVARAFTGWTIANAAAGRRLPLRAALHDDGEKIVLGHTIKAGGGETTASRCSTSWRRHPSTARFIATKLARRFVSDTPPPALVDRAADAVPRDRRRHPRGRCARS